MTCDGCGVLDEPTTKYQHGVWCNECLDRRKRGYPSHTSERRDITDKHCAECGVLMESVAVNRVYCPDCTGSRMSRNRTVVVS